MTRPLIYILTLLSLLAGGVLYSQSTSSPLSSIKKVGNNVVASFKDGTSFQLARPGASYVLADSATGPNGSTATKVKRFSNVSIAGSAITYNGATDANTNGSRFTINEPGLYSAYYSDSSSNTSGYVGVGLNAAGTTSPEDLTAATRICFTRFMTTDEASSCESLAILKAGDVVTAQNSLAAGLGPNETSARTQFKIFQILRF